MYKKIISLILALTLIIPTNIQMFAFAEEGPPALPIVSSVTTSNWEGNWPTVGDDTFYIEIVGNGFLAFSGMESEVFTKDGEDYTKVASQIESLYLGKNANDMERFVFKMKMDGGLVLASQFYYIDVRDGSGNYLLGNRDNYNFNPYPSSGEPSVGEMDVREISSTVTSLPINFTIYGLNDPIQLNSLTIELVKGNMHWGIPEGDMIPVANLSKDTMVVDEIENGYYGISGTMNVYGALSGGDKLYLSISDGVNTNYSWSAIKVLDGINPAIDDFRIINGFGNLSGSGTGHHDQEGEEDNIEKAFFVDNDVSYLDFSFVSSKITDSSKLSVLMSVDGNNVANLIPESININPIANNLYSINGRIQITGTIPADEVGSELKTSYDGILLNTTIIKKSELSGASQLFYDGDYQSYGRVYDLPTTNPIAITLVNTLNLDPANITATLNSDNVEIPLNINHQKFGSDMMLTLTPTSSVNGLYNLELYYEGERIKQLYFDSNENSVVSGFTLIDDVNIVSLSFSDNFDLLLKYIGNQDNNLFLKGTGFAPSKTYTAHFIKRVNSPLNAIPFETTASYVSHNTLEINSSALSQFPRGWYTIYIKENSIQVKGFADTSLRTLKSGGPVITLPTVKINNDDTFTTKPNVSFSFTGGTYDEVKFSETEAELDNIPWQPISSEITFTLSNGYGKKTVYFIFKSNSGSPDYSLNKSIDYRGTSLNNMIDYGVSCGKEVDNVLVLSQDNDYTFFINSNELNLTGQVEFLDSSDEIISSESMRKTSSREGIHTYSKTINIPSTFIGNLTEIRFYLKDIDNFKSKEEIIDVIVRQDALISNIQTNFKEFYYSSTYVLRGSEVEYKLWGTPNFVAKAILSYIDQTESNKTVEYILTGDSSGLYSCKAALPNDISKVFNIEYSLTETSDATNTANRIDEKPRSISADLSFSGLQNSNGEYNGKIFSLQDNNSWFNQQITIGENKTTFDFKGLPPSNNYRYSILDYKKTYSTIDNLSILNGESKNVNLSEVPVPAKVKFISTKDISGSTIYVDGYGYLKLNTEYDGFSVGQNINYSLYLSEESAKTYIYPEKKSIIVDESLKIETISLGSIPKIILKGTVLDEKRTDRKLGDVNIYVSQNVNNGSSYIYYNSNITTNEDGKFEIEVYDNDNLYITASKDGYNYWSKNIDNVDVNSIGDIKLSYSTKNIISFNLFTRPIVEQGTVVDPSILLALDPNKLSYISLTNLNGSYLGVGYYRSGSTIRAYNGDLANKNVRIKFNFYDMLPESEYYDIQLDEYGNGVVNCIAVGSGAIKANVIIGGDNSPTAYMMLYDSDDKLSGIISGEGSLSSESIKLEEGSYTAFILKGYELDKLSDMKTLDAFNSLDLEENIHYISRKNINVKAGEFVHLGDIEIPELVPADILSIATTSIKTRYIPNNHNGEVHVLARFNPNLIDPDLKPSLKSISIISSGTIKSNEVYYNGKEYTGNYVSSINSENPDGALFFTLMPSALSQLNLTIRLQYLVNGKWIYEDFGVDNMDVPKVSIVSPSEVLMGEGAKKILVRGFGNSESEIEIYDNDHLVGKTTIPKNRTNYETYISLTNTDIPVAHVLYAKMITKENEEHISDSKICEIIDPSLMAYTSDFLFEHSGRSFRTNDPKNSSESVVFSYVPWATSKVSFRINNLLEDQLEYVALVSTYNGKETYFEASHVKDVELGKSKYSEWEFEGNLGIPGDFSVYYALKSGQSLAPISGTKPIDFEKAIETPNIDLANVPASIRDNLDNRVIEKNTSTELDVVMNAEGGGSVRLTGKFSENHSITESELKSQGYRKFDTLQGYYWAKESFSDSGNSLEYHKSVYFSPELTNILKGSSVGSKFQPELNINLASAHLSDMPFTMLASSNDVLSKADYAGYVYNVVDIVNDTSPNPANFGKVGTGMQVLGGVVLAGQVLSGPTTKDHNTLYAAAAKIDSALIRANLGDEIRQYDRARRSSHRITLLFGGISYGAGFAGFVGKGLSYVVSTGSAIYDKNIGSEYDIWWDSIMRMIQAEIDLQEARKNKKDKPPKPGKKDDQKKPNWKIDPSGYVFEAIDSNRIEGVLSTALVKDELLDDFIFWDKAEEWEETNPVLSDKDGKYGWDVPPGDWKVRFEKDGYLTTETKSMTVPPAHEEVNIGLMSTKTPAISGVAMDSSGVEIEFDIFMQGESINLSNINVFDGKGKLVPINPIQNLIVTEDIVYKTGGDYQTDIVPSTTFVKRIRLIADEALYPGGFREFEDDGETLAKYKLVIRDNLQSYAGVRMIEDYSKENLTVTVRGQVANPSPNIPSGEYGTEQNITLSSDTESATIYYTLDGSEPTTLSSIYKTPILVQKITTIKTLGSKVGMDNSEIVTMKYNIVKGLPNIVSKPVGNLPSGSYSETKTLTLSSSTEGANIYYTLDGTIPSSRSAKYNSPIEISTTQTIKAVAIKTGYVDSSIATFSFTITKDTPAPGDSGETGSPSSPGGSSGSNIEEDYSLTMDGKTTILRFKSKAKDGVAIGTIDETNAIKLIENAMTNKSNIITIAIDTDNLNKLTFNQPKSLLRDIIKKTQANLLFTTPLAEITLSRKSIEGLIGETGDTFALILEKSDKGISIKIQMNDKVIEKVNGGISVVIPNLKPSISLVPMRVKNDGSLEALPKSIFKDGFMLLSLSGSETIRIVENKKDFSDLSNHWAKSEINFVAARELFSGTGAGVFSPNLSMTRGMLVTVLHRLEGTLKSPSASFNDVEPNKYYTDAVSWASSNDIVQGTKEGIFAPNDAITREQLATIIYRYAQSLDLNFDYEDTPITKFKDFDQVSSWANLAIKYAINSGLINGKDGKIDPKGKATRAEVATILQRFIQNILAE